MFILCSVGFAIALHGLFPFTENYSTPSSTLLELFFTLIADGDGNPHMFEGDPNESVGVVLLVAYVIFCYVVLMNVVIATFAVRIAIS